MRRIYTKAFSLAELLVVVGIISVLLSIVLGSMSSARAAARDKQRLADMHRIYLALLQYQDDNGGLPKTVAYGEANTGGWDYSSQGDFLTFLKTKKYLPSNILDPSNNGTGDVFYPSLGGAGYAYAYYCYDNTAPAPYTNTFSLGVKMEVSKDYKADYDPQFTYANWIPSAQVYWLANREPVKKCLSAPLP